MRQGGRERNACGLRVVWGHLFCPLSCSPLPNQSSRRPPSGRSGPDPHACPSRHLDVPGLSLCGSPRQDAVPSVNQVWPRCPAPTSQRWAGTRGARSAPTPTAGSGLQVPELPALPVGGARVPSPRSAWEALAIFKSWCCPGGAAAAETLSLHPRTPGARDQGAPHSCPVPPAGSPGTTRGGGLRAHRQDGKLRQGAIRGPVRGPPRPQEGLGGGGIRTRVF